MTGWEFAALLFAWAVAGGSPGPATLAIAGTAMGRGRAAGLAISTGIICGSAIWGLAAALGMSALMLANAWAVEVIRYLGAAYLMFLAYKAMKSALSDKPLAVVGAKQGDLRSLFFKGLLVHLTNPKAIFAWGAIFAIISPPRLCSDRYCFGVYFTYYSLVRCLLGLRHIVFARALCAWIPKDAALV